MEATSLTRSAVTFQQAAGEPEPAHTARGCGCCWLWEAKTHGKHQLLLWQPHLLPLLQGTGDQNHSLVLPGCASACQASGTGQGHSWWHTIPLAHSGWDAPGHCCIVSASVPASVPRGGQPGCSGCRLQPGTCTHMQCRAFTCAAFHLLSICNNWIHDSQAIRLNNAKLGSFHKLKVLPLHSLFLHILLLLFLLSLPLYKQQLGKHLKGGFLSFIYYLFVLKFINSLQNKQKTKQTNK